MSDDKTYRAVKCDRCGCYFSVQDGTTSASVPAHTCILDDKLKDKRKEELVESLEKFFPHFYCEDAWYSCPKATGGCLNDSEPLDQCTCGADKQRSLAAEYIISRESEIMKMVLEPLEKRLKHKATLNKNDMIEGIEQAINICKEYVDEE